MEWMKKYNEIGQKAAEEVTTAKEGGDITTSPVPAKRDSLNASASEIAGLAADIDSGGEEAPTPAPAPPAPAPKPKTGGFLFGGGGAEKKEEPKAQEGGDAPAPAPAPAADGGDDDAAAMLASAGNDAPAPEPAPAAEAESSGDADAAAMFANAGNDAAPEPAPAAEDDPAATFANAGNNDAAPAPAPAAEEEDPAAMFANAGNNDAAPAPAPAAEEEEPAAMFANAAGGGDGGETTDDEVIEEVVDEVVEEEVVVEEVEESVAETEGTREYPESPPIEEGDNWVPKPEETTTEEIVVDEDGNEIVDEVIEEDVLVDEDGNEIIEEEAVMVDEDGNEIIEEIDETPIETIEEEDEEAPEEDNANRDLSGDLDIKEPIIDLEAQRELLHRTPTKDMSFMSKLLPCFVFLAMIIAGLLVAVLVFEVDIDGVPDATDSPTPATLPLGPTNIGMIDVAETTPFAAATGNCNFGALEQPHVIDQCSCGPTINKIADDVLARYDTLVPWIQTIFDDWDETASSCSPRNQALVWFSSGTNLGGEISSTRRKDRYLTGLIYIQQEGVGWNKKENWLSEESLCKWEGVFCDDAESVIGVGLQDNNLKSQLTEGVGMYDFLEFISVRRNQLNGTIPQEIFASKTLKSIDLYQNNFYGEIPSFDNDIPLETLHVGSNSLSGRVYQSIENAKSLKRLDLSNNNLGGTLPKVLFGLALEELNLNNNDLTGTIHTEIGTVTSLTELNIGGNPFTGSLPVQIGSLTNLQELIVSDAPFLSGRIPASFGLALRNLIKVVISGTSINGNLPETFGTVSGLEYMDFSKNRLRGDLSSEFGSLRSLKYLDLFNNDIAGSIPTEFGQLTNLEALLLENNAITGEIPTQLSNMGHLKQLTLQGNSMSGRAPDGVCDLRGSGLNVFIVDCPVRVGDGITGVVCDTPECCTSCRS